MIRMRGINASIVRSRRSPGRRERVVRRDFEAALLEPDAVEATGHQLRAHFTQPVVEPLAPACEPGRPVGVECAVAQEPRAFGPLE